MAETTLFCEAVLPQVLALDRHTAQRVDATCVVCEQPFSYERGTARKRRTICSPECKAKRNRTYSHYDPEWGKLVIAERDCAVCGTRYPVLRANPKTQCCSRKCGNKLSLMNGSHAASSASRSANARKRLTRICKQCGNEFVKNPRAPNNPGIYCSRKCAGLAQHRLYASAQEAQKAGRERAKARLPKCACGAPAIKGDDRCRPCRAADRKAETQRRKQALRERPCHDCGKAVGKTRGAVCDRCMMKRARRVKNSHEHARRRLLRAVKREIVDPLLVFERDKWRCQDYRCGKATPKRLMGLCEPRSPTLDHIIPLSKGGEHSYRNSQLLCFLCNSIKSAGAGGQLRLF